MLMPTSKRAKSSECGMLSHQEVQDRIHELESELAQYMSEVEGIESGSLTPCDEGRLGFLRGLILACKDSQIALQYHLSTIISRIELDAPLILKTVGGIGHDSLEFDDVMDGRKKYVNLSAEFLAGSGIAATGDLTLYVRDACRNQVKFIRDEVIEAGKLGFILGQPGTGKSVTCFYVGGCLVRIGWTVTWIHLSQDEHPIDNECFVVRMCGDSKLGLVVEYTDLVDKFSDLNDIACNNHLLIVDGIAGESHFRAISSQCRKWLKSDTINRRLVYVSSMGWSGKPDRLVDRDIKIGIFKQWSWTYDEYCAAIGDPIFANGVSSMLDASTSATSIEEKVEAKYFLAGGCARYMFEWRSEDIRRDIDDILETISDVRQLTKSYLGERNSQIRNRLLAMYPGKQRKINSKYAEICIATMLGPDDVRTLARSFWLQGNPGVKGLCLESFFFACTATGQISLYDRKTDQEITWKSDVPVYTFDPLKPDRASWIKGSWLRPINWKNPAFDAVFLFEEKRQRIVKFVQITRRQWHKMDLLPCRDFLDNLKKSRIFNPNQVEISFVVPRSIVSEYKIGPIVNERALEPFGWSGVKKTIKANIQILGIDFEL
jgi:hypothetical protein